MAKKKDRSRRPAADAAAEGSPADQAEPVADEQPAEAADVESEEAAGPDEGGAETEAAAPEPAPSPEEILRRERDEFEERWLRSVAELDNFRKRSRRGLDEGRRLAVADLLRDLLEVLDDFERALQSLAGVNGEEPASPQILAGVELMHRRFVDILAARGLQKIEAVGEEFDPAFHEAIQQLAVEGTPAGQIVEVVQEGYLMHGMVLRPCRVVVAK